MRTVFLFIVTSGILYNALILLFTMGALYTTSKFMNFIIRRNNAIHLKFLSSCIKCFIIIIAVVLFGQQFSATKDLAVELFKSTGLLVAVLGFAAQSVLADVIAGMVISFSKPYDIGERVTLVGMNITGIVEDITLRHTVIKAFDNSRVLVPNSVINKEVLQNSNFDDSVIGTFLEVGISYDSDIDRAIEIIKEVVLAEPLVIDSSKGNSDKTIAVRLSAMADSSIILKTTVWTHTVDDSFAASSNIKIRIIEEFRKAGIQIPYPHVSVVQERKS